MSKASGQNTINQMSKRLIHSSKTTQRLKRKETMPQSRVVVVVGVGVVVVVVVVLVCLVASDFLTVICHLAILNVCVIIIFSVGNTQIRILLLCFLYLFVELTITLNE